MKKKGKAIGILGLWHLGCVYAASLAAKGFNVTGFDFDKDIIDNLKRNIPPLFEPELEDTLKKFYNKNLMFTSSEKEFFSGKDYIFVTFDIPVDNNDNVQLEIIKRAFSVLTKRVPPDTIVVISSQVPIGTSRKLVKLLTKRNIENPKVICFPENLRLGKAFDSFLNPERIVLGSDNVEVIESFKRDFSFFKCPFVTIGLESAEMVKHALNSYLATCISFSSELSDLSEQSGVNMSDVVAAIKMDKRVSPYAPINPGLGFAGGTLGRDVQSLRKMAKRNKHKTKLLDAIYSVNQDRIPMLIKKIHSIYPTLKEKSVGILGLTYKPNTNTLRRSMSLELINKLKNKGCKIKAFDPGVKDKIANMAYVDICKNTGDFFENLDIVILMTDWPEFKDIKAGFAGSKVKQKIIIDTKNFLNKQEYEENGFTILRIGEGK